MLKANGILCNIIIFGKSHIFDSNELWPSWFRPTLKIGRSTPMLFPLFPSSWCEWLAQKWADIKVLICRSLKQMFFPSFWGSEATLSLFLIVPYENKAFLANLAIPKLHGMFFLPWNVISSLPIVHLGRNIQKIRISALHFFGTRVCAGWGQMGPIARIGLMPNRKHHWNWNHAIGSNAMMLLVLVKPLRSIS